ncbi:hypothetical protein D3C72_1963870 [compost metagenome]
MAELRGDGGDLLRVHDRRRFGLSRTAHWLEARGLDRTAEENQQCDDHSPPCTRQCGVENPAVRLNLAGIVPERIGGYWHFGHGLAIAAGGFRRQVVGQRPEFQ